MAISDTQKVDLLFKKIGYGVAKTDVATSKSPANETVSSPLLLRGENLWTQSDSISNVGTLPTSNVLVSGSTTVAIYRDSLSSSVQTTNDATAGTNRTWKTGLTNWIGPEFGSGYAVKVYTGASLTAATASTGTSLPVDGSGNNDSWYFDYQSGVLNFADTNVPSSIAAQVWVIGARYTGAVGIATLPALTVTGNISSTNGNIVLTNGNITAQNIYGTFQGTLSGTVGAGSANVAAYEVTTPLSNNQTYYLKFANVTSGNSITGAVTTINVNPSTGTVSATTFSGQLAATNIAGTVATANVALYNQVNNFTNNQTYYLEFANVTSGNSTIGAVSTVNVNPNTSTISALAFAGGSGAFTTLNATGVTQITNATTATSTASGALQVSGGAGIVGNLYVGGISVLSGNVTIGGNLTVTGNSVSIGASTLSITDPIINLNTPQDLTPLTTPTTSDIGIKMHYYDTSDSAAFLGRASDTGYLEWYSRGTDTANVFVGTVYGTIKPGALVLANAKAVGGGLSANTGALQVWGDGAVNGNLYVGGTFVTPSINATPIGNATPSTGAFTTLSATGATTLNTATGASFQGVIGNVTPAAGTFTTISTGGLQAVAIGNVTPGTAAFTTVTGGSFQGIIGNVTPTTAFFTTATATTVNAATIGNIGASIVGNGGFLSNIIAANIVGTVGTANISLYDNFTNTTTNATFYPSFFDKLTGNGSQFTASTLTFNPSTGALTATSFNGIGTFSTATTSSTLIASGNIVAASGTASTNSTTGALVVVGGAGVSGNLNVAGTEIISGNLAVDGGQVTMYDSILDLHTYGNLAAWAADDGKDIGLRMHYYNAADKLAFFGLENSTKSLQFIIDATEVAGNVTGTFGNAQIGSLFLSNTTAASGYSATTSGALYVAGGAGVAGALYTGGLGQYGAGLQNTPIGNATPSTAAFTTVTGGSFQGIIGNAAATTGYFTTLTATTVNAATIGNTGAAFTGATLTTSSTATIGGNIVAAATTATNDNNTGSIVAKGGIAAAGNLNVAAQAFVGSTVQANPVAYNSVIAGRGTSSTGAGTQYAQIALVNATNTGSTDFAGYPNNTLSDLSHGWVDMGITGDAFNDAAFTITKANDSYLFGSAANATVGGNLVLATDYTGSYNDIVVGVGSFYANSEVARFHGNTSNNGTFIIKLPTTNTNAANTGALQVWGGASLSGNTYIGGLTTGFNGAIFNTNRASAGTTGGNNNNAFIIQGVNDSTLFYAKPLTAYDAVVIGGNAASSSFTQGAKLVINSTDSVLLPIGSNAQRPGSSGGTDVAGMFRYSSTAGAVEWYNGTAWQTASTSFTVIADQQFSGTGSQTIFTLSSSQTTASCIVSINGVVQIPTLAYAVTSGTTLTFTEAPASGDVIDVRMLTTTQTIIGISDTTGYNTVNTVTGTGITFTTGSSAVTTQYTIDTRGGFVTNGSNVTVASSGTATVIDSLFANTYSSAEYTITATLQGTNIREISKINLIHNGDATSAGTATANVYGTINTAGNSLVTWSAATSGNIAQLKATTTNANTIFRIKRNYQAL
jgi:hypothetical protein